MHKLEDIALSIGGAIVVAGAIYFIDKQLAKKQAALASSQTASLGANDYTQQQELLAAFSVQNQQVPSQQAQTSSSAPATQTSSCACHGGSTTLSDSASQPTAAQKSIQISLNNLLSASENSYTNYNTSTLDENFTVH